MTSHRTLFRQSDERQALEQLEKLHREIQKARQQRERAGEEFEGFVAGFQDPHETTTAPRGPVPSRRPRPRPSALARIPVSAPAQTEAPRPQSAEAPPPPPDPTPAAVPAPTSVPTAPSQPAPPPQLEPVPPALLKQPRGGFGLAVAALALIGIAGATYIWRSNEPGGSDTSRSISRPPAPAVVLPHADADSGPPVAPDAAIAPLHVEIATVRAVWLRATVDGHRAVEREVPAGTRMTFTPSDSITIRAGDAGAVRLKIGSAPEEPLGADGEVLTRVVVAGSPR